MTASESGREERGEDVVLREAVLGREHRPTGRTVHYAGGEVAPAPSMLRIVRFREGETVDAGFYLRYLAANGEVLTDTWHATLEDALRQAEFEFTITPDEWIEVAP